MASRLVWTSDTQQAREREAERWYQNELRKERERMARCRVIPVECAPGDIDYIVYDPQTGEYEYN